MRSKIEGVGLERSNSKMAHPAQVSFICVVYGVPKGSIQLAYCCMVDISFPLSRFACKVSCASRERSQALSHRHGGDDEGGDKGAAGATSSRHDDGDCGAAERERPRPGKGKEAGKES